MCGLVGLVLQGFFFVSLKLKQIVFIIFIKIKTKINIKNYYTKNKKLVRPIFFLRKFYLQWRSHTELKKSSWIIYIKHHLCLDCDVSGRQKEKISHICIDISILKHLERISGDKVGCVHHPTKGKGSLFHGLQP